MKFDFREHFTHLEEFETHVFDKSGPINFTRHHYAGRIEVYPKPALRMKRDYGKNEREN